MSQKRALQSTDPSDRKWTDVVSQYIRQAGTFRAGLTAIWINIGPTAALLLPTTGDSKSTMVTVICEKYRSRSQLPEGNGRVIVASRGHQFSGGQEIHFTPVSSSGHPL